jgi:hypothetical protein
MALDFIRPGSLNVLVTVAELDPNITALMSGLRGHYSLICVDPVSAVDAVDRGFSPDLAFIDTSVPGANDLARKLTASVRGDGLVCIALARPSEIDLPDCFAHRLNYPVFASDFEQLFWRLSHDRVDCAVAPSVLTTERRLVC